jgi:hypothetical protein
LTTGPERGGDLRDLPFLMRHGQRQPGCDLGDAGNRGDAIRLRLREAGLRAGREGVVREVLAGLAQRGEVGFQHAIGKGPAAVSFLLGRDRQVGADARERIERRLLSLVEPVRERSDDDYQRNSEREPEHGQDRAALAPQQLAA